MAFVSLDPALLADDKPTGMMEQQEDDLKYRCVTCGVEAGIPCRGGWASNRRYVHPKRRDEWDIPF